MTAGWKRIISVILVLAFIAIAMLGKWDLLFYGLILLCPLMHFFGHNHHGGHNDDRHQHKH